MADKKNMHTISVKVANKPGVLLRCAQVFARRGYNIDSLVVSPGVNPKYSRMTITAQGDPETLEQIIKQTGKLVDVLHSSEHTGEDSVTREVALLKLRNTPPAKSAVAKYAKKYGAVVINDSSGAIIIEQTGTSEELDEFESVMKKYGIIEMVRSGKMVMAVGKEPT